MTKNGSLLLLNSSCGAGRTFPGPKEKKHIKAGASVDASEVGNICASSNVHREPICERDEDHICSNTSARKRSPDVHGYKGAERTKLLCKLL